MYIVMPYSLYDGDNKVTPKEFRLFMLLNKLCVYESGIKQDKKCYVTIDMLSQMLQFDKSNIGRSRKCTYDAMESLKTKTHIEYNFPPNTDGRSVYYALLTVTFKYQEPYHQFESKYYYWTSDGDELMILGYISKWEKTTYLTTVEEYADLLGYSSKTKTIKEKLDKMVSKEMITNIRGKWNVEKGQWNPNKQKIVKEFDPDAKPKEQLPIETRDHNFDENWNQTPLTVDDFIVLLTSQDDKWIKSVRRKLKNIGNKHDDLGDMFIRLEQEASEQLEEQQRYQDLQEEQIQKSVAQTQIYDDGFFERLQNEREEERNNEVDVTTIFFEEERRGMSDDEFHRALIG